MIEIETSIVKNRVVTMYKIMSTIQVYILLNLNFGQKYTSCE